MDATVAVSAGIALARKSKRACFDCLSGRNDRCCNRASLNMPCSTTLVAPEVNTDAFAALGLLSATGHASLGSTGHFWGLNRRLKSLPNWSLLPVLYVLHCQVSSQPVIPVLSAVSVTVAY